jgi:UDP-N-acetylglucosamine:LPS N-acetylglucosamine transferase
LPGVIRDRSRTVAIVSAGMGAGHDEVAAELARRLEAEHLNTVIIDVWSLLPLGLGRLIPNFYRFMIQKLPWMYEGVYRFWIHPPKSSRARVSLLVRLTTARLARQLDALEPAVTVSTFHLASQILGELRSVKRLGIPVVSVVVDFAAHGLWVHPDVDLHLCLHPLQEQRLRDNGAREVVAAGPIVRRQFLESRRDRHKTRAALGITDDETMVLIVAGSWGTGDVAKTLEAVAGTAGLRPVIVAGRNDRLRSDLATDPRAIVFGWVDYLDRLIGAADVVVENAGGLTAMEALAAGTPVISFRPIPGHGKENVAVMSRSGISCLADTPEELLSGIQAVGTDGPLRRRLQKCAREMFVSDPASHIAALVGALPADKATAS